MISQTLPQQLLNAATLGLLYALASVGVALVFGVMRVLHVAHAAVIAAGAYAGALAFAATSSLPLAALAGAVAGAALAVAADRVLYRPLAEAPPQAVLIGSVGLLIAGCDLLRLLLGAEPRPFLASPRFSAVSQALVSLALLAGLAWALARTRAGFAARLAGASPRLAALCGVDVRAVGLGALVAGSSMAGVAGAFLGASYGFVHPFLGEEFSYKAIAVVVMGGTGVGGALLGAAALAAAETAAAAYLDVPLPREGLAMLLVAVVLLIRPAGLRGGRP